MRSAYFLGGVLTGMLGLAAAACVFSLVDEKNCYKRLWWWELDDLKTLESCRMAVQRYEPEFAPTLKFVPEALRTSELCLAAVKNDYHALYEVPHEIVTEQFLRDVIEYNKNREKQSYTYELEDDNAS